MIKVLHFTDTLQAGGKERQILELLKGLSGCEELSCELAIMSSDVHYDDINTLEIGKHYLIRRNRKDPSILWKFHALCKRVQPDIIHTWNAMTSVYALPIAKISGIKLLNGMIRDAPPRLKRLGKIWTRSKLTFPFSDMIVANTYAGLKAYNVPARKSICIHNGFDFQRTYKKLDPEAVRQRFQIHTDQVVGMVASFSSNKDYATFIAAAELVLEHRRDVTFLAVGDGEDLAPCKEIVRPQYRENIKFLGRQTDVESIVNILDVTVLSTYTEGLSNSIMEYMAFGKPVIATNSEGTRELVVDGKTGFLTGVLDIKEMTDKIMYLLEHKDKSKEMGKAGQQRIRNSFSLEKMTDEYIGLYNKMIRKIL